jgi:hypothetical protein
MQEKPRFSRQELETLQTGTSYPSSKLMCKPRIVSLLWVLVLSCVLGVPLPASAETYGVKDDKGAFVPKVTINIENKEILIKKTNPNEEFASISLAVNQKNRPLVNNLTLLNVQWTNRQNQAGKPLPFTGPRYNHEKKVFKDNMGKSVALKIIDKSTAKDLFTTKEISDLFAIQIDGKPLISSESFQERERTIRLGRGRDLSLEVDKTSIIVNAENLKTGEMFDVYNRTGRTQMIGLGYPKEGLNLFQVVRKIEQKNVPRDSFERFPLDADEGVFIAVIADPDPAKLASLDGKEITITVWEGDKAQQTIRIPIKVAPELHEPGREPIRGLEPPGQPERRPARATVQSEPGTEGEGEVTPPSSRRSTGEPKKPSASPSAFGGLWVWIFQFFNLVLLAALAGYAIFFLLPKIQVLEDRLAKNEMFLHGSREAIREELEEIKAEILGQCRKVPPPE